MAPTPQEMHKECVGDDGDSSSEMIVISGMAGLYPEAHNVKELADILYNKKNPVTHDGTRFEYEHPEMPRYMGIVPELERFDAQFFKVHYRLAHTLHPMARKLLEQTYAAIIDAGVCPEKLSGKKVAVLVSTSCCDPDMFDDKSSKFSIIGWCRTMIANRISYWLNTNGPSYCMEGGCCGGLMALQQARLALTNNFCEAAVVASARICLHPQDAICYRRVTTVSRDDKTRSFDKDASGPIFSEAINVLFLQKAKDALRVYAELKHVKCEYELEKGNFGLRFGFQRRPQSLSNFFRLFYKEANFSPQDVDYVEAFGSAVPEADKAELEAIDEVYNKDRDGPLLVGCVTSNIGYTETASGISAITKVLLGYHTGELAANLHLDTERDDIDCVREKRVHLLREHHPFREGYAAVNGMSLAGVNAHVLLHNSHKPKDLHRYNTDIPYLVPISGRHEEAVKDVIDQIKAQPIDPEQIALIHNVYGHNISSHMGRGYSILATDSEDQTVCLGEQTGYFDYSPRQLWFVYSGMGSQWAGMGAHLMQIPTFAAAIYKCHKVLEPKGLDIVNIMTSQDKSIFDNILNSFLGIAAMQIGLTDVLTELGLVPDKIIGHSVGELGCAYADGCITAEEMILAAYCRGTISIQTPFVRGKMAAVGIGYQQIVNLCPPDIDVACHNSSQSCTISGPAESINVFMQKLRSKNIFVKEVPSSNIAYHSRYIAAAGPAFQLYLNEIFKCPKVRTERWVSTSVPQHAWGNPEAKYSGAEYYTNNLLNPVLFEEASQLIPNNAVLVEIAPHGLLQAILKRSLPRQCVNIPLTLKGNNRLVFFLEAIGNIYMQGFVPRVSAMYPKINFPVSTGTPMLSHMARWAHDEIWRVPKYVARDDRLSAICTFIISIHDDDWRYLQGHVLRGRNVYPFAAVLVDVWDTLAMSRQLSKRTSSIQFHDVKLHAQPVLHERRQLRLSVNLHKGSGRFEVLDNVSKVASGFIVIDIENKSSAVEVTDNNIEEFTVTSEDLYDLAFNRECRYRGEFRSIHSATRSLTEAQILWRQNWVTFVDAMFQLNALHCTSETVSQPISIQKICINIQEQRNSKTINLGKEKVMVARVSKENDDIRCGGVTVKGINYRSASTLIKNPVLLKPLNFDSHLETTQFEKIPKKSNMSFQSQKASSLTSEDNSWTPADRKVDVTVHYAAGLNYAKHEIRTVDLIQHCPEYENTLEMSFSGKLNNGTRVMVVADVGADTSRLRARPELLWPVPEHWTLEDAATVPHPYCVAYYCLVSKYPLYPGMKIYVEDGISALGQALIAIASATGCEVFTTVGTARDKRYLLRLFPQLEEDHVCGFNQFADMILTLTKGKGCDFVISSPKGELMTDTLRCANTACLTIIINYGKDITFGMYCLAAERNVVFLNFASIFQEENLNYLKHLQLLVSEGVARGVVRPLMRLPTSPQQVAISGAISAAPGCVLMRMQDTSANPRLSCSSEKNHIILCNNEAFGLLFAENLVRAGSRRLIIHSPKALKYATEKLRLSLKQNIQLNTSTEELCVENNVEKLLTDSNSKAPVEGIHILLSKETNRASADDVRLTIHNLDVASRRLCPDLKFFTVLNEDGTGQTTCLSRRQLGYPATMVKLSSLHKLNSQDSLWREAFTRWEAVRALEEAVQLNVTASLAEKQEAAPSMLADIAQVLNIKDFDEVKPDSKLAKLGMDATVAHAVADHLQDTYGVAMSKCELLNLSVNEVRKIEEVVLNCEFEETKGLKTFFSHVENDELVATTEIVFPPTLVPKTLGSNEIAMKEPHLIIVTGMEGTHTRFKRFCERLQVAALVLQPGLVLGEESNAMLASRYVQTILKNIELKRHFYLMGYESGVAVALEMVSRLEKHGLTGTVFCIGGGPQAISSAIDEVATAFGSDEALQEAVIRHMVKLMVSDDFNMSSLDAPLCRGTSLDAKVTHCLRILLRSVSHSAQYVRHVIEAAYTRLQWARRCDVNLCVFRSSIVALLPAASHPLALQELQKFSGHPVQEYRLRAPLGQAMEDHRCAAIVNRHLSEDIRREFELKNRCDSYCLGAFN